MHLKQQRGDARNGPLLVLYLHLRACACSWLIASAGCLWECGSQQTLPPAATNNKLAGGRQRAAPRGPAAHTGAAGTYRVRLYRKHARHLGDLQYARRHPQRPHRKFVRHQNLDTA
jgi:hypothetical protein